MAFRHPLSVLMDVPEPRILKDRLVVSADGTTWDKTKSVDTWVDPITFTGMLMPLPLTPEWQTTTSGNYSRLRLIDYTLVPAQWKEVHSLLSGDIRLEGSSGTKVTTNLTWNRNQPFYLSFYVNGMENMGETTVIKFGWGVEGDTGSVTVRVRANGSFAVYKASALVGVYSAEEGGLLPEVAKSAPGSLSRRNVNLFLLPCRRRELLVVSSDGIGFTHPFADLDFDTVPNDITPHLGKFWWQVQSGWASVQCAPLKFKTSGDLYGRLAVLRYPPDGTQVFNFIDAGGTIGYGTMTYTSSLVDSSGATFVQNGFNSSAKIKAHFTGTSEGTPEIWGVDAYVDPTLTTTYDNPFNLTPYVQSLRISVPEKGPATGNVTALDPTALISAGLEQADITGNRTIAIRVGSVDILRGTCSKPIKTYGTGVTDDSLDELYWEFGDREQEFIQKQFIAAFPYDGLIGVESVRDLMVQGGFSASDFYWGPVTDSFELPYTPAVSRGEWSYMPERGQYIQEWITKFHEDFFGTWQKHWMPTLSGYQYWFVNPITLPSAPRMVLYQSQADALAGGVHPELWAYRVINAQKDEPQDVEANQIVVVGQEPYSKKLILSWYNDAASQAPGTAPGSRPRNWVGKVRPYQFEEPALTTQLAANRARDVLIGRLCTERILRNWESQLLVRSADDRPLWKTDVVRIANFGRTSWDDYRIIMIPSIELVKEELSSNNFSIRNCQYVGLKINSGFGAPETLTATEATEPEPE